MSAISPTLRAVRDGKLCSGCGLCAGVSGGAVTMEIEAPGFARPRQWAALTPAQERTIATSCPGMVVAPWDEAGAVADVHPAWGPYRQLLTGHAADAAIRFQASSGGMLTALAKFALEDGTVDAVVAIEAGGPSDPFANVARIVTDPDAVVALAGSRYSPSSPLCNVGELLESELRYAFIGKPCDVSALRQLGKSDPRVAKRFPLILSFFCGGVPSRQGSEAVVEAMGLDAGEVTAFRYRGNGWPGKARAETRAGAVREMDYETSWGRHLSRHVQFRCKICPDPVGGVADVACADAWFGGETGYPQFEDREGRSLVVTRTAVGEALVAAAQASQAISCEPSSVADIDLMQPAQKRRKSLVLARTTALALTFRKRPDFAGVRVVQAARKAPVTMQARNFLGTAWRIIKGRQ